ncbi:uncharacterized protein CTHT_0028970 [Thermochaetoides thermophila DSM 1495]|uniref:Translation initiation factor 3 C-terminal domain-containing protein n=1 Tax=Chaetomium thermophilum (strain DSM 1495 / CBS 144.50 / IMI 039719) TaxID=759272 RepID=G0S810_CHATD|nr:hypothetical protein CTHT_0028970 [Thermochaetoides thermophila DSM 1495]EGS21057.1 hypothetical protein CTHT_0028970 [Thermochaetoides thermophila DSM 1495]
MRGSHSLFNPTVALRKVFVSNAVAFEGSMHLRLLLAPAIGHLYPNPSSSAPSNRFFTTGYAAQMKWRRQSPQAETTVKEKNKLICDHNIPYSMVQIRQDDGTLSPPERTTGLLRSLNLNQYSVVLLAPPRKDDKSKGPEYAIVRIIDKIAERKEEEAKAAAKRANKVTQKQLEINWSIAPHDLQIRMKQLKQFLTKGYQVQVTLMSKRGKRAATQEEAKKALQTVWDTIADVPGTSQYKKEQGEVGKTVMLFIQGPTPRPAENQSAGTAAKETAETPAEMAQQTTQ